MEHEAYQEYYRTKSNKVSLAAWILINNNLISQNPFIFLNILDFTIQTLVTMALFNHVGCVPPLSPQLLQVVFFSNPEILTYINIGISAVLIATMAIIMLLILRDLSWQTYSERRIEYQVLSTVISLFRGPFFGLTITLIYGSIETASQLSQTYLRFVSLVLAIISFVILFIYTYLGSLFFNLASPTNIIPWSDNSPKPYQISCVVKVVFLLTVKLRNVGNVLMYSLAFLTLLVLVYKVYVMLVKTHITNVPFLKFMILTDFAQIHLLICFLFTMTSKNQQAFMYYILPFLPVSCLFGFFSQEYCKKMRFSDLTNLELGHNVTEGSLVYRYLIELYLEEINEDCHIYELQRLQQIHMVKCENYLGSIKRKMRQRAIKYQEENGLLMLEDIHLVEQGEDNEGLLPSQYEKNSQRIEQPLESLSSLGKIPVSKIPRNQKKNEIAHQQSFEYKVTHQFKKNPIIEVREASFGDYELTNPNTYSVLNIGGLNHQTSMLNDNDQDASDPRALSTLRDQELSATNNVKENVNDTHLSLRKQMNSRQYQQNDFKTTNGQALNKKNHRFAKEFRHQRIQTRRRANSKMHGGHDEESLKIQDRFEVRDDFQSNSRKEGLKKLVDHYFKYHLSNSSEMNFQLKLLKIFYTLKIMNNPYLAHFLLFSLKESDYSEIGFIDANVHLVNQRFIEEIISLQAQQEEDDSKIVKGKLDLEKMLNASQTVAEFDTALEKTALDIHDFWSCLLNQRDTVKLFTKGINISKQLIYVQGLIDEIQKHQGEQDLNVYLKMAQFYSNVLFKTNECFQMQEKARQHFQNMKVNRITHQRISGSSFGDQDSDDQEKCLIMAEINLKKPMQITFINKAALRLTQYSQSDVLKLSINYLMPQFIGDFHQHFVDSFLRTGKSRMIKRQSENFVKIANGTLLPVLSYLFINSMSKRHMILMFEPNKHLRVFDEPHTEAPFTFMLTDHEFKVGEIAQNFEYLTGIGVKSFKNLHEEKDRSIICDDIIRLVTFNCGMKEFTEEFDPQEVDVVFHSLQRNEVHMIPDQNSSEQVLIGGNRAQHDESLPNVDHKVAVQLKLSSSIEDRQLGLKGSSSAHLPIVYVMKIIELNFLGGKFKVNMLAFRRKPIENHIKGIIQRNLLNPQQIGHNLSSNVEAMKEQQKLAIGMPSESSHAKFGSENSAQGDNHYALDVHSQSSSVSLSSNSSNSYQIVTTYTQQVNSEATPKTLKFIMNIFLVIVVVMAIASSVVLAISLRNLSYALTSITVCKHSNQAMDELTTLRFLLRSVVNIYQGNEPQQNAYLKDRATVFENLMLQVNTEMRKDQIIVTGLGETTTDGIQIASLNIPTFFVSAEGEFFSLNQSINQGITLLHNKIIDVITNPERRETLGQSKLVFLNLQVAADKKYPSFKNLSLIERDTFAIINNTNGNLYEELDSFGPKFSSYQLFKIKNQSSYLTGLCVGMMAGILLSAFIVIPLFGRIQHRILELMKIFFQMDPALKRSILDRIKSFQLTYYSKKDQGGGQDDLKEFENYEESKDDDQRGHSLEGNKRINKADKSSKKLKSVEVIKIDKNSNKRTKNHSKKVKNAFGLKKGEDALEDIMSPSKEEIKQDNDVVHKKGESGQQQHASKKGKVKRDANNSSSESENEKEVKKKSNERQQEIKMAEIKMDNQGQEKTEIEEFSKFTTRKKIIQGLAIIILLSFMSSYFLIKFLLSMRMYNKIESSVSDLKIIFDRLSCSQNVINHFTESYFIAGGGDSAKVRNAMHDKHFSILQSKIDECMYMENQFQRQIMTSPQDYLSSALEVLQTTEAGDVCSNSTLGKEACIGLSEQVNKQGMMTFFFNIFKQVKQMEIDLKTTFQMNTYNSTFAKNQIKSRISQYIDTLMMVLHPIQVQTQNAAQESVYEYFKRNETVFSIIYGSFLVATILISIIFISNIYKKLLREMLLSNKLLYIIDFEQINEIERNVILKFLQHY